MSTVTSREVLVAQLPEPPDQIRKGIEDFYTRIDPKQSLSIVLFGDKIGHRVYSWKNPQIHKEATIRLSWQDLQNFKKQEFTPATILGTLLNFGCATQDPSTGEIKVIGKVPDGNLTKQVIVDYILAHKDSDGSWIVGGIKRKKTSDMVFQIGAVR